MIKKLIYGALLTVCFTLPAMQLWSRGLLDRWEYTTWNWRVLARSAPGPATDDVKLIMLDQTSLDWASREMGLSWPWPREVYAPIVQFARRGGARALAFDVLYTEASAYGVEDDQWFGEAIREGPPFVAALFLGEGIGQYTEWRDGVPDPALPVAGLNEWLGDRDPAGVVMPRATFPIPEVTEHATMVADVKGTQDRDGIIRRINLFRVFDERAVPSLGLAAYMAAADPDQTGTWPSMKIEEGVFHVGSRRIPIDGQGHSILQYRGPTGTHAKYSAAEIIQSELRIQNGETPTVSPDVFEDAYVFFGFSAPGLLDLRPTPISRVTPGVEVHATALDNFLSDDFVRTPSGTVVLWTTLGLVLMGTCAVLATGKAWQTVFLFLLFLPLPWLAGFFLYAASLWWPIIVQSLALTVSMVGAVVVSYALEGRQKAFIKGAFKHYLSPAVIDQIVKDPGQLKLGGERRTLSIFFSDLAGFSSISEKLEPQELTRLLNDYLSDMTDIILEEGGTLDKYEGDAIIAFWNAPLNQPDHARRAACAALRCQRKLAERRAEYRERTGVDLYARIGVNTGDVVVGNMGSRDRFDYTVLGDAANLASRLEGANKAFGTSTMLSESTWAGVGDALVGREIGRITVVGRKTPVRVFEVLGYPDESVTFPVAEFERALELCRQGEWAEALTRFEQWTDDPLSRRYAEQCRGLTADPARTWDGVWNLAEK